MGSQLLILSFLHLPHGSRFLRTCAHKQGRFYSAPFPSALFGFVCVGDSWIHEACQVPAMLGPNPVEPCASHSPPSPGVGGAGESLERHRSLVLAAEMGAIIKHRSSSSVLHTTMAGFISILSTSLGGFWWQSPSAGLGVCSEGGWELSSAQGLCFTLSGSTGRPMVPHFH